MGTNVLQLVFAVVKTGWKFDKGLLRVYQTIPIRLYEKKLLACEPQQY